MVCLNENISFNIKTLKNNLSEEMKNFIDEYDHVLDEKTILSLKNNIEKKIKSLFNFDFFIYKNMNANLCTFKHKRGNNEGYFCCKKIRKNKQDGTFLCANHNKKNKPIKRNKKNDVSKIDGPCLAQNNKKSLNKDELLLIKNEEINRKEKQNKVKSATSLYDDILSKESIIKYDSFSFKREINNNYYSINKKVNIYKDYIINVNCLYETLTKDFPLLDFCIKKVKNKQKRNHSFMFF